MPLSILVPLCLVGAGPVFLVIAAAYLLHVSTPFPNELNSSTDYRIAWARRQVVNPIAALGVILFFVGIVWLLIDLVIWLLSL